MQHSEKIYKKMVVNMYYNGRFGKCIMRFPLSERIRMGRELARRGWMEKEKPVLTAAGIAVAKANATLCERKDGHIYPSAVYGF